MIKGAKGKSVGCDSYRTSQLNPMDSPDIKRIKFAAQVIKNQFEKNNFNDKNEFDFQKVKE